jgi:hypothetical protein
MATATPWAAANAKFTANLSGSTSVAAGFMGSDDAQSIDLGGGRVLWQFGDTFWATAAGQTRSQCLFIRNTIAIQTGYDLSTATMTHYTGIAPDGTGTTPGSFYPEIGPCNWLWPMSGVMIDDKLLVASQNIRPDTNILGFGPAGWYAHIIDNPSATPTSWVMTSVPVPSTDTNPAITLQLIDEGDGYIYGYGRGTNLYMHVLRWAREDAKAGRLRNPEWWYGQPYGWSSHTPHRRTKLQPAPILTSVTANEGSVHKKSDNTYVTLQTPDFGPSHLKLATSPALEGPFSSFTDFYTPPESTMMNGPTPQFYVYAGKGHPEQTWSGQGTDDIVMTYATNPYPGGGVDIYTDMTTYWPKVVQVTAL